jgi:hypothetical protein
LSLREFGIKIVVSAPPVIPIINTMIMIDKFFIKICL